MTRQEFEKKHPDVDVVEADSAFGSYVLSVRNEIGSHIVSVRNESGTIVLVLNISVDAPDDWEDIEFIIEREVQLLWTSNFFQHWGCGE